MVNAKGKSYERAVAKMFQEAGWPFAKRHLEYQSEEAIDGRDLDNTEPFAVQCKCWKGTPSIMAINEVQSTTELPFRLAVLKRTMSPKSPTMEVAVLDLHVFMAMVEILNKHHLIKELLEMYDIR